MTSKKCPVCEGKKDWKEYPIKELCKAHRKHLTEVLAGITTKNIFEVKGDEKEL